MVTTTTGQATFKGASGKIYTPSLFIDDVVGNPVLWNLNGKATSASSNQLQFSEDVMLIDLAIVTGPTVMTGFYWLSAFCQVPASNQLISPVLTTIQTRSFTAQGFRAGRIIQAIEF